MDDRLFSFSCLRCGSVLEARAAQAGSDARCPSCDAMFTVPRMDPRTGLADGEADPGEDGELPAPVHAYAAAGHRAPKLVRLANDELEIECPRCQARTLVSANSCPRCGLPFTMEAAAYRVATTAGDRGQLAFLLGGLALISSFCPVIPVALGVMAVAVGIGARRRARHRGDRLALLGIVFGVLAALISLAVSMIIM